MECPILGTMQAGRLDFDIFINYFFEFILMGALNALFSYPSTSFT